MIMTHVDNRLLANKKSSLHLCLIWLFFVGGGVHHEQHMDLQSSTIFVTRVRHEANSTIVHPLRIHIFNINLHLAYKSAINVSKYTSPKDPMGPYWCIKTSQNWWFICHLVTATDDRIEGYDTWWSNCAKQCNGLFANDMLRMEREKWRRWLLIRRGSNHFLRMVMEPEYLSDEVIIHAPQSSSDSLIGSLGGV